VRVVPWGLAAPEVAEVLRALRFRYFKWDTYAVGRCLVLPEALVLTRREHQEVVSVVEALHGALARLERRVRGEPELLAELGIPAALHPLVAAEPETELQLTRYDLFPTPDGRLMVSEFNEDVPGGFNEAVGLPRLLAGAFAGLEFAGDLAAAFTAAFVGRERVALMYATAYSEDLQHMLALESWLAAAGHQTVLCSPAHLERRWGRPAVMGTRVDAAFRFFPGEWMPRLPNFPLWLRLGPRLPMMNPFYRLVRQSKKVFALWRRPGVVEEADRELLERHGPFTEELDPGELPRLAAERERWVLKQAFGRMGDSVVMGSLETDESWQRALAEAAATARETAVQECFRVTPMEFAEGPLYPAIGAFLVNGRFAGYYSRAAARPFLNHEAYHVATLVEAA
jgi:glutathionylspermidine synthase